MRARKLAQIKFGNEIHLNATKNNIINRNFPFNTSKKVVKGKAKLLVMQTFPSTNLSTV